jgi:NAD(P)-dependent dehydrogenase (short-subunit alcohol dehydrogenase family)
MAMSAIAQSLSFSQDLKIANLFGVAGRVCIVTGGSKGVGLMIASGLVQNGARVYIFSRKPDHATAEKLTTMGPGSCISMACDVTDRSALDSVAAEIGAKEDAVHLLVNNSGATWGSPFAETPRKSWDKLFAVNVTGLFECSQVFCPLLEKGAQPGKPASIINIGSIDGLSIPQIEEYAYTASKAAVIHLTKQMAAFLAPKNLTVNCISPGLFPSKMGDAVVEFVSPEVLAGAIPLGRYGHPMDIASAVLFLAGAGGAYTTGSNIVIDGGILIKPRM